MLNDVPSCTAGVPFLQALPQEALGMLAGAMRHRHFARGDVVALAGEPVEELVIVARGRLDAVQGTTGGREQVVRTLGPGEFYGELGLFAPTCHEADLVAAAPTDVCLLGRAAISRSSAATPTRQFGWSRRSPSGWREPSG